MTKIYGTGRCRKVMYFQSETDKTIASSFELWECKDTFEIWCLGTLTSYMRKGCATKMLCEFLAQFDFSKPLRLYVLKRNKIAIHLYEKVGFKIIGDKPDDCNAYMMQYFREE